MTPDPALAQIRKTRHAISREVGHDPKRLVDYYRKLQEQHRDRLIFADLKDKESSDAPAA